MPAPAFTPLLSRLLAEQMVWALAARALRGLSPRTIAPCPHQRRGLRPRPLAEVKEPTEECGLLRRGRWTAGEVALRPLGRARRCKHLATASIVDTCGSGDDAYGARVSGVALMPAGEPKRQRVLWGRGEESSTPVPRSCPLSAPSPCTVRICGFGEAGEGKGGRAKLGGCSREGAHSLCEREPRRRPSAVRPRLPSRAKGGVQCCLKVCAQNRSACIMCRSAGGCERAVCLPRI